jgi:hypothetical protein
MLCSGIFLPGVYLDSYINKPFTIIEILFTVLAILIAAIIIGVLTGEVKF